MANPSYKQSLHPIDNSTLTTCAGTYFTEKTEWTVQPFLRFFQSHFRTYVLKHKLCIETVSTKYLNRMGVIYFEYILEQIKGGTNLLHREKAIEALQVSYGSFFNSCVGNLFFFQFNIHIYGCGKFP
ncbi:MAG: hypothetical protein JWL86_7010 [Rhizobium sp.]|nr:hypothetical protein [Rhizobium sp.]